MKSIVSIGDVTMDCFNFISDANVLCDLNKKTCNFCVNYASKVPAEKTVFSLGGNAANTSISFARLGLESSIVSQVGTDWIGKEAQSIFEKEKVDSKYLTAVEGPSNYSTALVYQGERTLIVYHVPRQYEQQEIPETDAIYLTSVGENFTELYNTVLSKVKTNKTKLYFNPGTYQLKAGITTLKKYLAHTDILFVNLEEAKKLTELNSSATIKDLAEALFDSGSKLISITDGSRGAYCYDGYQLLHCKIFPSELVEKTGAGDAYASAFVAATLNGENITEAMRWGMANSASAVKKIGSTAGLLELNELKEILNDNHQIQPTKIR